MKECVPGPFLADANSDIWNCTAMGGRTPGYAAATSPSQYVAKWVKKNCSKVGENCQKTMCCADETNQCYEKNKKWASCSRGCKPGIHKDDKDKKKWTCRPLGPRTPRKWKSPTLYCYSVIRLQTYEADILRMQAKTDGGIGIFGCDEYDVFAAQGRGWIGDGPNGPVWTHHFVDAAVTRSIDNTAGNTQLFRNVWHAVKLVGKWQFTEWTVKMDPDAVLFAPRLRSRLKPHTKNIPVFFQNCASYTLVQQGGAMMFGSVEVISHLGISKYLNIEESACNFGDQYGEDRWFGECLKSLGVYPITDPGILGDKLCVPGVFDCANGEKRAAYHFYKDVGSWMNCYHQGVSAGIEADKVSVSNGLQIAAVLPMSHKAVASTLHFSNMQPSSIIWAYAGCMLLKCSVLATALCDIGNTAAICSPLLTETLSASISLPILPGGSNSSNFQRLCKSGRLLSSLRWHSRKRLEHKVCLLRSQDL